MKNLGMALRHAIEQSGYSIYKTATKTGINRTTLQKILSGDRPVSAEQLRQILSVLKLSPAEEEDFMAIFEIAQSGETLYSIRQTIRHLFVTLFDMDGFGAAYHGSSENTCESNFSPSHPQIITGSFQVESVLRDLILKECRHDEPLLRFSLPGDFPCLASILPIHMPKKIRIQHITRFLRSPAIEQGSLTNLNILSALLPLSMHRSFDYQIHYFYDNQVSSEPLAAAFPYYILLGGIVILLNSDGSTALPCTDKTTVRYFSYLFENSLRKTLPLIERCTSPDEIIERFIQKDAASANVCSIEFQPCLVTFMEDEFFHRYAREDIPDREIMLKSIISRRQQLAGLKDRQCIFSKSGISQFAATGLLSDLPSGYMKPLSVPDRIRVLENMHRILESGDWIFRATNPVTFPLPAHLVCLIHGNTNVEFSYMGQTSADFKHICIQEHTILDAFEDFFQYTLRSSLVYSREETLDDILNLIEELKNTP